MKTKKTKLPLPNYHEPRISVFHHKHGTSFAVIPSGTTDEKFWQNVDGYSGEEDEFIESSPLPAPYHIAEEMLQLLKDLVDDHEVPYHYVKEAKKLIRRSEVK